MRRFLALVRDRSWAAPTLLVVTTALPRFVNLSAPLTDRHWIRQTRSAWTSLLFARDGIDLLHPRVPGAEPPWIAVLEFPIVQAVVALVSKLGLDIDTASRLVGALGFTVLAVFLYRVVVRLADRRAALVAIVALSVTPFAFEWGRSAIVDVPGAGIAMLGLDAGLMWRAGRGRRYWVLAAGALVVAALIKVTLVLFLLPLLLLYRTRGDRRIPSVGELAWLATLFGLVLGAALAWNAYTGIAGVASLKSGAIGGTHALSEYLGTIQERLDPVVVAKLFGRMALLLGGVLMPLWVVVAAHAVGTGIGKRQAAAWAGMIVAVFGPIVLFWPVFVIHAYYMAAVVGPFAALVGLAVAHLLDLANLRNARLLLASLTIVWVAGIGVTFDYWARAFDPRSDPSGILPLADQLRARSNPGDVVVLIHPEDRDASILYYADRLGWVYVEPADQLVIRRHCSDGTKVFRISGLVMLDAC